jgi:membrane associated rhomboid family serine protease
LACYIVFLKSCLNFSFPFYSSSKRFHSSSVISPTLLSTIDSDSTSERPRALLISPYTLSTKPFACYIVFWISCFSLSPPFYSSSKRFHSSSVIPLTLLSTIDADSTSERPRALLISPYTLSTKPFACEIVFWISCFSLSLPFNSSSNRFHYSSVQDSVVTSDRPRNYLNYSWAWSTS